MSAGSGEREASWVLGIVQSALQPVLALDHHGIRVSQGGEMSNERILVADLGHEWLQDAEFKAEYDALVDEFALAMRQVGDGKDDARHNPGTHVQENEMPHEFGSTHQSR